LNAFHTAASVGDEVGLKSSAMASGGFLNSDNDRGLFLAGETSLGGCRPPDVAESRFRFCLDWSKVGPDE
jgi:hypothetical protein